MSSSPTPTLRTELRFALTLIQPAWGILGYPPCLPPILNASILHFHHLPTSPPSRAVSLFIVCSQQPTHRWSTLSLLLEDSTHDGHNYRERCAAGSHGRGAPPHRHFTAI